MTEVITIQGALISLHSPFLDAQLSGQYLMRLARPLA
jgi:hypothetical protein